MLGMKNHFDISGSIEIREVDIAGVACICTIVFTVSFSSCINVFVWHNSSLRKHAYESINTITIQFGESLQSKLSPSEL